MASKKTTPAMDPMVPPPMTADESCKLVVADVGEITQDINTKVRISFLF
jgi:hypothetical protein